MGLNRKNEGKLRWSLAHYPAIEEMLKVLEFGAAKYAKDGWKKGLKREENLDSMQRHLAEMMKGIEIDSESGHHHIGHLMCCAMFHYYFYERNFPHNQEH